MKGFDDILAEARKHGPKLVAVAGEPGDELGEAAELARAQGIATCRSYPTALAAAAAVRSGEADLLIKGLVDTKEFMAAVLDREQGLRSGRLVSHVAVIEVAGRLRLVTDSGICLAPTLEDKIEIIRNALPLAHRLGMNPARVAVLAAVEKVNPKMPETVDAAELAKLDLPGCVIQGPLAVDNAVSEEAARIKGVSGPVAGRADILLVPSVLAGNMFCKGIMYFADCRFGGLVAGTSRPVAFLSRADSAESKLNTIALGVMMSCC